MKINFLLSKNFFFDHCSYSFIFPIIKSINEIKDKGIDINFVYSLKREIFECDILIIDSRFLGSNEYKNKFLDYLEKYKNKKIKLIYSDTADNCGQIKEDFLEIVDDYWKGQILKNKNEYMNKHYGGRLFTNYYNKKFKLIDKNEIFNQVVKNKKLLKKIRISWNMGLADHGMFSHIKQKIFSIFRIKFLIRNTKNFYSANFFRQKNLACRIGTFYKRETVQFQRKQIYNLLEKNLEMDKISRFKYLNEIKKSKISISPYGWGEICPRDFEIFLNGGILLKPEMKTIETWPNWYISNKTYIPFSWDISNLKTKISYVLNNYSKLKKIAITSQKKYLYFTTKKKSKNIFVDRFIKLIKH